MNKISSRELRKIILSEAKKSTQKNPESAKSGVWSGGDNLSHSIDWDKAYSLEGENSKDLKDILDHKDVDDVVHALHNVWAGNGPERNLVRDTDWLKTGKIKESTLRKIISQELRRLSEGCGCGCGGKPGGCMDKKEAPLSSDEAFGAGYNIGQEEREDFSYSGDLPQDPDDAMGLGYEAGKLGLGGEDVPDPESYDKVRNFLNNSGDLVAASVDAVMKSSGSTCPVSTAQAMIDHLQDMLSTPEREDAWAGGDNLEEPLDHYRFETGESNAGPHPAIQEFRTCELPEIIGPYMSHRTEVENLGVPCPDSYRNVGDTLISTPSRAVHIISQLMEETGASCPSSAAQALADIIHFANMDKFHE